MKNKPFFSRIELVSNHGTDQGVTSQFFLQMQKMSEFAFSDENERNSRIGKYMNVVFPDFEVFYNLYHEINEIFNNYQKGILNGEFFTIDERGTITIDRSLEINLKTKIKDFFIKGRILINNWAKSKAIDDDFFCLNDLLIVNDSNFLKNKKILIEKDELKRYDYLFNLIEKSRNEFLTEFNQIRADIEHQNFTIPNFIIDYKKGKILFKQPKLRERNLIELLEHFYSSLFDFIEKTMIYYLGINAYLRWNGRMTLYKRKNYNFKELKFKYVVLPRHEDPNLTLLIN